jgi:acetolactate synthase-1/3 small subunit
MNTFIVLVENVPGVLTRVASLVRRRGFNIESLTVGHTENADVSRMTIVIDTDDQGARRVEANLYKLLNVLRVDNITGRSQVVRDLALIKVNAAQKIRSEVLQLAEVFRARIVDVSADSVMIEATGPEEKIDCLVDVLKPYGILEMARTGRVAMARGAQQAQPRTFEDVEQPAEHHDAAVSYSV